MDFQLQDGWIEVITGCMYAGKTEELLRRVRRIEFAKKKIFIFKSKIDNRYSNDEIVSHNSNKVNSILIENANEIYQYLENKPYAIAIDEAQFFNDEIIEVCEDLANKRIRVIVAGLDRDFRGEPFGPMPQLLARAEYVTKLSAICYRCGAPATRTQRLVNDEPAHYDDPIILVGAKEQYEACCRHCHIVKGKK